MHTRVQEAFLPAYITILNRRKDMPFTQKQKEWQGLRRGHYVEYNLMIDEGTQVGYSAPVCDRH